MGKLVNNFLRERPHRGDRNMGRIPIEILEESRQRKYETAKKAA